MDIRFLWFSFVWVAFCGTSVCFVARFELVIPSIPRAVGQLSLGYIYSSNSWCCRLKTTVKATA